MSKRLSTTRPAHSYSIRATGLPSVEYLVTQNSGLRLFRFWGTLAWGPEAAESQGLLGGNSSQSLPILGFSVAAAVGTI